MNITEKLKQLGYSTVPEEFYTKVIMQDKLAINLQYLESRTLFKDFKIILNTFVSILK